MRVPVPVPATPSWERKAAKWLFIKMRREPREDDGIVTAFRDGQVTLRSRRREEGFTNALQEIGYQGVRAGDLVIHSMDGFAGAIGISDSDGKASPVVHCYRPAGGVEARYYAYLLRDLASRGFISALAKGIRERSTAFDAEALRSLVVPVPPHRIQVGIADFLDAETARIDALIEKNERIADLVRERLWSQFVHLVRAVPGRVVPLRRVLTRLVDGPFGSAFSSDDYSSEGARVIRLGNIGFAEYRSEDEAHIPLDLYRRFIGHRVEEGDLLVAGLGDTRNHAGRACLAPDLGPAIVKGKCFCGRVDTERASAEYLAWFLSSPEGVRAIGSLGKGSTRSMINLDVTKAAPVKLPGIAEQVAIVNEMKQRRRQCDALLGALSQEIGLLEERRLALITSAVTGSEASSGVGE